MREMVRISLFAFLSVSLTSYVAGSSTAVRSNALRHKEQSVVVLSDHPPPKEQDEAESSIEAPVVTADSSEIKLVSSMSALLNDEDQAEEPSSTKAKLQRKLVALIWLERVFQQNLDSMDEAAYSAKIAKSRAGLEKDTSPATAAMLSQMRTEMHDFSVPFYRNAVQDELTRVRKKQKVLLDKLIALDAGEEVEVSDVDESASLEEQKTKKVESPTTTEKPRKKEMSAEALKAREQRRAQSNMFILIMSIMLGVLICIVCGIALKVQMHSRTTTR